MDLTDNGIVFTNIDSMIEGLKVMISRIDKGTLDFFGESSADINYIIEQAGTFFYKKGKEPYSISELKYKTFEKTFNNFVEKLEIFSDKIKDNRNYVVEEVFDKQLDIFMIVENAYNQFQTGREEYRKEIKNLNRKERRQKIKKQQELEK